MRLEDRANRSGFPAKKAQIEAKRPIIYSFSQTAGVDFIGLKK
jgi:hypothetical protein